MKLHLLSVFSLLGLSTVSSALAVRISHNVHNTHEVNTASGIKASPDEHTISAPKVIKTLVVTTVQATKNFPSTLYSLIIATHPERHPHFIAKRAKRDLNQQEGPTHELSEAFSKAGTTLGDVAKAISGFVGVLVESNIETAPENGANGHIKRDLNDMMDEMSWMQMTDDPHWMEANNKVRENY